MSREQIPTHEHYDYLLDWKTMRPFQEEIQDDESVDDYLKESTLNTLAYGYFVRFPKSGKWYVSVVNENWLNNIDLERSHVTMRAELEKLALEIP